MWRDGEGKRSGPPEMARLWANCLMCRRNLRAFEEYRPWTGGTRSLASALRNDGSVFERKNVGRHRKVLAPPLKQHPPLKSARSHNGKTRQDLFPDLQH